MVLGSPSSYAWLAFTRDREHSLTRVMEMFQGILSKFLHYVFSFFLICRCKKSICNFLIPRVMGVLGSQNSAQVASWDVLFRVRCRWRTSRSKLTPLSVSLCPFSGRVCDYQAELVISKATQPYTRKKTWCLPHISRHLIWLLVCGRVRSRAHPLFCAMPAGRVACNRTALKRWSFSLRLRTSRLRKQCEMYKMERLETSRRALRREG